MVFEFERTCHGLTPQPRAPYGVHNDFRKILEGFVRITKQFMATGGVIKIVFTVKPEASHLEWFTVRAIKMHIVIEVRQICLRWQEMVGLHVFRSDGFERLQ